MTIFELIVTVITGVVFFISLLFGVSDDTMLNNVILIISGCLLVGIIVDILDDEEESTVEIERKFLVKNNSFKNLAIANKQISQAYINEDPRRTVRIRKSIQDGKAECTLTIKGISTEDGLSRYEFEHQISEKEYDDLQLLCSPTSVLYKTRYIVKNEKHVWEVDVFSNLYKPLTIAEVELNSEDEDVAYPEWIGQEVTGDVEYYNVSLLSKIKS